MATTQQLAEVLKRLNAGEDPEVVRNEAKQFLATINPADLSLAEQSLIDAGLRPEDLRKLCAAHMEVLGDDLQRTKGGLRPGHVIHTLLSEHEVILDYLGKLEKVNEAVQRMDRYDPTSEELKALPDIAEHLEHAEPHHQREEDALFPELEQRGVFGPPQIMRLEHVDLRKAKKELGHLANTVANADFATFKKGLAEVSGYLVPTLRDHIFKENNILYPTALDVIREPEVWRAMKLKCDEIGYCCFTPTEEESSVQTLDLRPLPPFQRHELIFRTWDSLEPGDTMKIINDHDPKPLRYQFEVEYKDHYQWQYEEQGPVDWVVTIKKS